jgi:hypothetical protein
MTAVTNMTVLDRTQAQILIAPVFARPDNSRFFPAGAPTQELGAYFEKNAYQCNSGRRVASRHR